MQAQDTQLAGWKDAARKLGEEHARNAASWVVDGNSDRAERARVLAMMRDGDPAADQFLPRQPDLSGEFADAPTPRSIFEDITSMDAHAEATWNQGGYCIVADALCSAYEEGVGAVFQVECERLLIAFCE